MGQATFDRRYFYRVLLTAVLLCWPLLLTGHPAYFFDSASYFNGGAKAISLAHDRLATRSIDAAAAPNIATTDVPLATAETPKKSKVARAAVYSVAAYLLRWPGTTMTSLVLVQAVIAALVIVAAFDVWAGAGARYYPARMLALAVTTPVAFMACFIMPDIFAGPLILAVTLLGTAYDRISPAMRVLLIAIAGVAIATHASHAPLAAGLFLVGVVWLWRAAPYDRRTRVAAGIAMLLPTLLGNGIVSLSGLVAFGEANLAPKRFPLTLARSIDDGPARWYLEKNCATLQYEVCKIYGSHIPTTVSEFLFSDHSIVRRATPEQLDRVRAEEAEIVFRAALAYPGPQLRTIAASVATQLVAIKLPDLNFDSRVIVDGGGKAILKKLPPTDRTVVSAIELATVGSTLLAIVVLLAAARSMTSSERGFMILLIAGLLGNAVICAVFSGVGDRYQARIIWLLPFAMLAIPLRRRNLAAPLKPSLASGTVNVGFARGSTDKQLPVAIAVN